MYIHINEKYFTEIKKISFKLPPTIYIFFFFRNLHIFLVKVSRNLVKKDDKVDKSRVYVFNRHIS